MSNLPVTPTEPQAGQPDPSAQGTQGTAPAELSEQEKAFRAAQSRFDQYVSARMKKLATAFDETPAQQSAQAAPAGQSGQASAPNALTQWAKNVEIVMGTTLEPSDPESALILQSDPLRFQESYLEAMRAKKARIAQAASAPAAPTAPPITPTTAGGVGAPVPKPELIQKYKAEISQPGLTTAQRLNIRVKYRREGLEI